MHKLVKLERRNHLIFASQIKEYLSPDYVYVPVNGPYKSLVSKNEHVLKGQILFEDNLNKIISTVSGNVVGAKTINVNGNIEKSLVIENDFKETEKKKNPLKNVEYNKIFLISKLYEFYFKYIASTFENKKINNLLICTYNDEPYIFNNSYIANKYYKEILEVCDILSNGFGIANTSIVMKSNDSVNIEKYLSKIGTYPNINLSLVEDKYLLGKSYFLMEYFNLNEMDTLVLDVKTLYEIYYAIKYNKFFYDTFITVAGDAINKCYVMRVRVGTRLSDIVLNNIKITYDKPEYILNGLMMGHPCDINDTVVDKHTQGLLIMKNHDKKEELCNNCGLCYKICPIKINPKKYMDNKKKCVNCIDCGLCSYICPCHINIRRFLRGENE